MPAYLQIEPHEATQIVYDVLGYVPEHLVAWCASHSSRVDVITECPGIVVLCYDGPESSFYIPTRKQAPGPVQPNGLLPTQPGHLVAATSRGRINDIIGHVAGNAWMIGAICAMATWGVKKGYTAEFMLSWLRDGGLALVETTTRRSLFQLRWNKPIWSGGELGDSSSGQVLGMLG